MELRGDKGFGHIHYVVRDGFYVRVPTGSQGPEPRLEFAYMDCEIKNPGAEYFFPARIISVGGKLVFIFRKTGACILVQGPEWVSNNKSPISLTLSMRHSEARFSTSLNDISIPLASLEHDRSGIFRELQKVFGYTLVSIKDPRVPRGATKDDQNTERKNEYKNEYNLTMTRYVHQPTGIERWVTPIALQRVELEASRFIGFRVRMDAETFSALVSAQAPLTSD